jgi:hypothetical protein
MARLDLMHGQDNHDGNKQLYKCEGKCSEQRSQVSNALHGRFAHEQSRVMSVMSTYRALEHAEKETKVMIETFSQQKSIRNI